MPALPSGANAGSDLRGGARVDSLLTALEGNAGRGREARVLLHRSGNTAAGAELDQRDYRHVCAGVRSWRDLLAECRGSWSWLAGTLSGWQPGLGNRTFAGRHDRVRHQSRARFWAAA